MESVSIKVVNPAVIAPLQEALTTAYWFKSDLRTFLRSATGLPALVDRYEWNNSDITKRDIVRAFVSTLVDEQHVYRDALIALLVATPDINPSRLKTLDDGDRKFAAATAALEDLRPFVEPYRALQTEAAAAEQRRRIAQAESLRKQEQAASIEKLHTEFLHIHSLPAQSRGYALEKFLNRLFETYDIEARGPFSGTGEQIDGAFTFESADYLLEAKWQKELTANPDISVFRDKVGRRLDNTLGLFVSFSGFQPTVMEQSGRGMRETVILMDGADLMTVLDQRLTLKELLHRKKQHAARTGEIMLRAADILDQL
jgi:hypothetical protein